MCLCANSQARSPIRSFHKKPLKKTFQSGKSEAKEVRKKIIFIVDSYEVFQEKKNNSHTHSRRSIVPTTDVIFNGIVTHLVRALTLWP